MKKPDIHRLLDLQRLLLAFGSIERTIDLPSRTRLENDVEHSYSLAMAAWFLSFYFPELDRDRLIRYALAHDLVELYAGDTFFITDDKQSKTKKDLEQAAFDKLQKEWPDFSDLLETIATYEQHKDREAKFIYALDKIMPLLVIYLGEGYTWHRLAISRDQLHAVKAPKVAAAPELVDYYDQLQKLLIQNDQLFPIPSKKH